MLGEKVDASNDEAIKQDFNYLQVSDHFYYMSTKFFSDGDVHSYFNPYDTPYDAFINYMNVLSDFEIRVNAAVQSTVDDHVARLSKIIKEKDEQLEKLHKRLATKQKTTSAKTTVSKTAATEAKGGSTRKSTAAGPRTKTASAAGTKASIAGAKAKTAPAAGRKGTTGKTSEAAQKSQKTKKG
jgi:alpha-amylase